MKTVQYALVLALLFALMVAVFAVQNTQEVVITFLFWGSRSTPLVLVILGSAAGGALFVAFLGLLKQLRLVFQNRELQAKIRRLEAEAERRSAFPGPGTPPATPWPGTGSPSSSPASGNPASNPSSNPSSASGHTHTSASTHIPASPGQNEGAGGKPRV